MSPSRMLPGTTARCPSPAARRSANPSSSPTRPSSWRSSPTCACWRSAPARAIRPQCSRLCAAGSTPFERHRPLLTEAEKRFKALKLDNIVTRHGDGLKGWPEQAPFDRILLSAAVAEVPLILIEQLKLGGRLIAPVGPVPKSDEFAAQISFSQQLTQIIRTESGIEQTSLIPVMFVPMVAGLPEPRKPDDAKRKTLSARSGPRLLS